MARRARRAPRNPEPAHYRQYLREAADERRREIIKWNRAEQARYAAMRQTPTSVLWARNLARNGEPGECEAYCEAAGIRAGIW